MSWECFVIEPTDRAQRYLRRFGEWEGEHLHAAMTRIEDAENQASRAGSAEFVGEVFPIDDPRWPTHCACGYQFAEGDSWQLFYDRIYVDVEGREYTLRDAPAGAMWRCTWYEDHPGWVGPDGQCWAVMLPPGGGVGGYEWVIDGPATGGGRWTRTGEPPKLTARPSILRHAMGDSPAYHGWLTDGVLSDDIEGRTYG